MNRQNLTISTAQHKSLDPWERLANAVVTLAVDDYRTAAKKLKKNPANESADTDIRKLNRFFRSQWFQVLTDVDGDYLLSRLKKEAA